MASFSTLQEIVVSLAERGGSTALIGFQKEGAQNIIPVAGKEHDTELPPGCCDAIFLREVYHHLTDPLGMDRSLYRAMRPGARLAIIDFEPNQLPGQAAPPGVPANRGGHGVPKRIVAEELIRTGFVLIKTLEWPISGVIRHYCILFIKPSVRRQPTATPGGRNEAQVLAGCRKSLHRLLPPLYLPRERERAKGRKPLSSKVSRPLLEQIP